MLHRQWRLLRVTGFGIAVASKSGSLLGYGFGWPPSWCTTAAAAEAWALQVVLETCPFPPKMRTDCLALLSTAREGSRRAEHHSRPLARIWRLIRQAIDVDIASLVDGGLLAWVPAHKTLKAVGEAKDSNGNRLTIVDWRANRLVDMLAKLAAEAAQASKHTILLLKSAEAAAAHAACLLGVVTHAANNYVEVTVQADGEVTKRTLRDSTDRPRKKRAVSAPPAPCEKPAKSKVAATPAPPVAPWKPPSGNTLVKREEAATLARRVDEIGSSLTRSASLSGKARLDLLAARVRAKRGE